MYFILRWIYKPTMQKSTQNWKPHIVGPLAIKTLKPTQICFCLALPAHGNTCSEGVFRRANYSRYLRKPIPPVVSVHACMYRMMSFSVSTPAKVWGCISVCFILRPFGWLIYPLKQVLHFWTNLHYPFVKLAEISLNLQFIWMC